MNILQNIGNVTRFTGSSLFVSGYISYDSACANEVSAAEPASPGGSVKELAFSFYDCFPVPQEPQITVLSDSSGYTVIAEIARDFRGWLTVTAYAVIRSTVQAFRRIICEVKAFFCRRVFLLQGELRL